MGSDYDETSSEEESDAEENEESDEDKGIEGAVFDTGVQNSHISQSETLEEDNQGAEDSYNDNSSLLAPSSTRTIGRTPLPSSVAQITTRNRATQELLEWRRQKGFELFLTGKSPSEISRILQVSLRTVERDLEYMKSDAKQTMRKYFTHTLPEQVLAAMLGLTILTLEPLT